MVENQILVLNNQSKQVRFYTVYLGGKVQWDEHIILQKKHVWRIEILIRVHQKMASSLTFAGLRLKKRFTLSMPSVSRVFSRSNPVERKVKD